MTASRPIRFSFASTSVDEAEALFSGQYAPVKVRPQRGGELEVHMDAVIADGVTVFNTQCPTGVVFETESSFDGYNLTIPVRGGISVEGVDTGELQQTSGSALAMDGRQVTRANFSVDMSFCGISIASQEMHASLAELIDAPVHERVRFGAPVAASGGAVQLALVLAGAMRDGMDGDAPLVQAPAALASLRQALVRLVLEVVPNNYTERLAQGSVPLPAPRHVRRAIDYIVAHAAEPMTVGDIARASLTKPRTLQSAFQRFKGVTPMAYLRGLRLSRARADLLDSTQPDSVSQIALRWGFFHPGMFSVQYREAYGESPSSTIKRRR